MALIDKKKVDPVFGWDAFKRLWMKTPRVRDTHPERARGLVWIRTLACGAGDPGFKSQRARQKRTIQTFVCRNHVWL